MFYYCCSVCSECCRELLRRIHFFRLHFQNDHGLKVPIMCHWERAHPAKREFAEQPIHAAGACARFHSLLTNGCRIGRRSLERLGDRWCRIRYATSSFDRMIVSRLFGEHFRYRCFRCCCSRCLTRAQCVHDEIA